MTMTSPEYFAVFRADASREIGAGHVRRCLALSIAFEAIGWRVGFATDDSSAELVPELANAQIETHLIDGQAAFAVQTDALFYAWANGVDVAIVDHYGLDATFEQKLNGWAHLVVVLDDLADRRHDCDLLFDSALDRLPADYAPYVPPSCEVLTGPAYALLAPDFAAFRPTSRARRSNPKVERIAISLGGGDPGPVLQRVLEGIAKAEFEGEVEVVLGVDLPAVQHFCACSDLPYVLQARTGVDAAGMAKIFARADLAIGAGGTSSWERCCLGLPTLVIVTARNQREIVDGLSRAGAVIVAGWHEEITVSGIAILLSELITDTRRLSAMSEAAFALCDGRGAERAVEAIVDRLRDAA